VWRIDRTAGRVLAALLLMGGQAACADATGDLARREAQQLRALEAAIGTPRCSIDSQCWAVPVGAKPCGGPESYLPASTLTADRAKVQVRAADLAATRRKQHELSGRVGICIALPEPPSRCELKVQRCSLGASSH
jgi:hypothetical protein